MSFCRPFLDRFSSRLLVAGLALSLFLTIGPVKAADPGLVASVKSYLGSALKSAAEYFESDAAAPQAAKADPDELARRAELVLAVRSIFLAEKG